MFFVTTNEGGMCLAFPDVCKTPVPVVGVVPIPYPNIGQCSQAKGSTCSSKVKILGKKVCTKKTEITRSQGDEPGVQKGLAVSKHMDKVTRTMGKDAIKVEGDPIVTFLTPTSHNGNNAPPGVQLSPSQTKVVCSG